jgi:uncharacterized cupin superfamily protein
VGEAELERTEHGTVPVGDGWFVLNAKSARWYESGQLGKYCGFEDEEHRFPQLGINLNVLEPGEPMSMYHWEADQEDFLVLFGEARLVVEGEERRLNQWDFFHCPARTQHVIVGAGSGPCVVLAVGARVDSTGPNWGAYTVDDTVLRHGAGVTEETTKQEEAYARFEKPQPAVYRGGWLPEL